MPAWIPALSPPKLWRKQAFEWWMSASSCLKTVLAKPEKYVPACRLSKETAWFQEKFFAYIPQCGIHLLS
jgi:hypothetical protein